MDTFNLNVRLQAAATCFLVLIVIMFIRKKKLPLMSTKCFKMSLAFTVFNIIFDMLSVYTITHLDTVPGFINKMVHQFFIGSLDASVYCFFLYCYVVMNNQKRPSKLLSFVASIPITVAMFYVVFGDINYSVSDKGVYSYGPMATTVYITVAIYMMSIFACTFNRNSRLQREKVWSIRAGTIAAIIVLAVQIIDKYLLVSGLALVLMVFMYYMSIGNPVENIDSTVNCFNLRAYHLMLAEYLAMHKTFYVVDIVMMNLQTINNKYGHEVGHKLQESVIDYLSNNAGNYIFKTKENTITVLVPQNGQNTVIVFEQLIERFKNWFYVGKSGFILDVNINVLECPRYAYTVDQIFDITNYVALSRRKMINQNADLLYITDKDFLNKRREDKIEEILRDAIVNDGFDVYYQPIYSAKTGNFASAEALIRLKDNTTLGYISPEEFITIAEERCLILEIGDYVLERVCHFAHENRLIEKGVHYIEVNVSGMQAVDPKLSERFTKILQKHDIPPEFINLEITETASIESGKALRENMISLCKIGCEFSLDDFGTGYSNLAKVSDANYKLIKLDKSLIWPAFDDKEENRAMVLLQGVISMIKSINGGIVAEGVETEEQVKMLIDYGVDYLQGFYYSRPVTEKKYLEFIIQNNIEKQA